MWCLYLLTVPTFTSCTWLSRPGPAIFFFFLIKGQQHRYGATGMAPEESGYRQSGRQCATGSAEVFSASRSGVELGSPSPPTTLAATTTTRCEYSFAVEAADGTVSTVCSLPAVAVAGDGDRSQDCISPPTPLFALVNS